MLHGSTGCPSLLQPAEQGAPSDSLPIPAMVSVLFVSWVFLPVISYFSVKTKSKREAAKALSSHSHSFTACLHDTQEEKHPVSVLVIPGEQMIFQAWLALVEVGEDHQKTSPCRGTAVVLLENQVPSLTYYPPCLS